MMTIVLSSFMLVGCSQKEDGTKKIGLIVSTLNNPFFVDLKKVLKKKQKNLDMKL